MNVLNAQEIKDLTIVYNDIKFDKINKEYNDSLNIEPEIIRLPDESDWD